MTIERATIHGKAPVMTAQRSRSNRIQYAAIFGTLTLLVGYFAVYDNWQEYFRDPISEHLFIAVVVSCSFWVWPLAVVYFVVPKVEFFENHLVARSLWGFTRKRNYKGISKLEVKHEHLDVMFYGGDRLSLSREETKLEDLIRWLAEREVTAAKKLEREPWGKSEDRRPKQEAVEAGTAQNKVIPGPVLTLQSPAWTRIYAVLLWGVPGILSIYAEGILIGRCLSNPTSINLVAVCVLPLAGALWLYYATLALFPKVEFFESHIVVRSQWGRSRRRSYLEIMRLAANYEKLDVTFNDWQHVEIAKTDTNIKNFVRWLSERGVTAARNFNWEESRSPEWRPEPLSIRPPK